MPKAKHHQQAKLVKTRDVLATPEQLAEIHSLLQERRKYMQQAMALFSSAASVLTPTLVNRYLLGPGASLHFMTEAVLIALNTHLIATRENLVNTAKDMQNSAIDVYEHFKQDLSKYGNSWGLASPKDTIEMLDILSSPEPLPNLFKRYPQGIPGGPIKIFSLPPNVKDSFINVIRELYRTTQHGAFNPYIIEQKTSSSVELTGGTVYAGTFRMSPELLGKSFGELYSLIETAAEELFRSKSRLIQTWQVTKNDMALLAGIYTERFQLAFYILAGIGVNQWVVSPLSSRIYDWWLSDENHKRYQHKIVHTGVTYLDAEEMIRYYETNNARLKMSARKSIIHARYLIPLMFISAFLFSPKNYLSEFAIFGISLVITALTNLSNEIREKRQMRQLTSQLNKLHGALNQTLSSCQPRNQSWELIERSSLETSYFKIHLSPYKKLSAPRVCETVSAHYRHFGINVISHARSTLVVSALSLFNLNRVAELRETIEHRLDSINEGKILTDQINSMMASAKTGLEVMRTLENVSSTGMCVYRFTLYVSNDFLDILNQNTLATLFPNNTISFDGENLLEILGYAQGVQEHVQDINARLKKREREIKLERQAKYKDNFEPAAHDEVFHPIKNKAAGVGALETSRQEEVRAPILADIPEGLHVFRSNCLPKNKFFTLWRVDEATFLTEPSLKKAKALSDYPKIAAGKNSQGAEGIIFLNRKAEEIRAKNPHKRRKDINGHSLGYIPDIKMKILGDSGWLRLFGLKRQTRFAVNGVEDDRVVCEIRTLGLHD